MDLTGFRIMHDDGDLLPAKYEYIIALLAFTFWIALVPLWFFSFCFPRFVLLSIYRFQPPKEQLWRVLTFS
jgi:hypothetical protein